MGKPWHSVDTDFADGTTLHARFTTRHAGDFHIDSRPAELSVRRNAVVEHPWLWLRQVHGSKVQAVVGRDQVATACGTEADASVTSAAGVALAVSVADCAPVLLWSNDGVFGAVHAGWKGVVEGVVANTVAAMFELGASGRLDAVVGPHIHPGSYEFGPDLLDSIETQFGSTVRANTDDAKPALDLSAALGAALAMAGVDRVASVGGDTADAEMYFSARVRNEPQRQVLVAWKD